MLITGSINDPKVRDYLKSVYGLSPIADPSPVPVFAAGEAKYIGGFKGFYALLPDIDRTGFRSLVDGFRRRYGNIQLNISLPFDPGTRLINHILDLKSVADAERRFGLYEKKTRNLVKKSYKNDLILKTGKPPETFYGLYADSMRRLSSQPRNKEWFSCLESALGDRILAISIFDGERLIGVNYCLISSDYVLLMFNASDPSYWSRAVNDRLYDELVKWSIEHEIRHLDFGPSVIGDVSHTHFKEGFGAKKWYIANMPIGDVRYRLRHFMALRMHNLKLRFAKSRMKLADIVKSHE